MLVLPKGIVLADINNPFKGDFQNCTCKSHLEALFLIHSRSLLKGDFKNDTYKSYPEALFPAYIRSPFKGDF